MDVQNVKKINFCKTAPAKKNAMTKIMQMSTKPAKNVLKIVKNVWTKIIARLANLHFGSMLIKLVSKNAGKIFSIWIKLNLVCGNVLKIVFN